jgi:hypothetical protein
MRINYTNLNADGELKTRWDVLLRIVGDFSIESDSIILYEEFEFCLVEFAVQLTQWLKVVDANGPDFTYTSLESDQEWLIRFQCFEADRWVFSAWTQPEAKYAVGSIAAIREAANAYLQALHKNVIEKFSISDRIPFYL